MSMVVVMFGIVGLLLVVSSISNSNVFVNA